MLFNYLIIEENNETGTEGKGTETTSNNKMSVAGNFGFFKMTIE